MQTSVESECSKTDVADEGVLLSRPLLLAQLEEERPGDEERGEFLLAAFGRIAVRAQAVLFAVQLHFVRKFTRRQSTFFAS